MVSGTFLERMVCKGVSFGALAEHQKVWEIFRQIMNSQICRRLKFC